MRILIYLLAAVLFGLIGYYLRDLSILTNSSVDDVTLFMTITVSGAFGGRIRPRLPGLSKRGHGPRLSADDGSPPSRRWQRFDRSPTPIERPPRPPSPAPW